MSDVNTIKIPALGRPFTLGSLYDCKQESLKAHNLWKPSSLVKFTKTHLDKSEAETKYEEVIHDKWTDLEISSGMRLSFLCGLIEVSGSAEYLQEWNSSELICRYTAKCCRTSHYKSLTMNQLANCDFPVELTEETPTHVVTGIQYGGDVFIVIEKELSASETKDKQSIMVKMKTFFHKVFAGESSLTKEEEGFVSSFSFKFYGDCHLPSIPTDIEGALKAINKAPSYLKKSKGIPKVITLTPLSEVVKGASSIMHAVDEKVQKQVSLMLEDILDIKKSSEHLQILAVKNMLFQSIIEQQQSFLDQLEIYMASVRDKLRDVLPRVRSGDSQSLVSDIVADNAKSPFGIEKLKDWQSERRKEALLIKKFLKSLPEIVICNTEADFSLFINDPDFEAVYCLTVVHTCFKEQLEIWQKYNSDNAAYKSSSIGGDKETPSGDSPVGVIRNYKKFVEEKNNDLKNIGFGAFEKLTDTEMVSASVQKYENGRKVGGDVEMLSILEKERKEKKEKKRKEREEKERKEKEDDYCNIC